MNWKQKMFLWFGIAAIVTMGLRPPYIWRMDMAGLVDERNGGYAWIVAPPVRDGAGILWHASLDLPRLCVQWIIVAVITAGLLATFRDKRDT